MEQKIRKNASKNPRENANIFSIATFFYNYPIFKKGKNNDLEEKDLYKVLPDFEAHNLGNRLESQWHKDKKNKNGKLWKSLTKCFGLTYLFYAAMQLLFGTGMIVYQPKVFSKFVAYFQPNQTALTTEDAYLYASSVILLNLLNTLYTHNFVQLVTEYSLKVRTAVCSLIFRKALKINPGAFSEITVGNIVTLVTKDVFAIDAALTFIKDMVIGFLQLIVVTYILYQRVGVAAFRPIAVIVMIIPIQIFTGKKTTKTRLKTAKRTDQRFSLIQETLSAIKIIKMYTWQAYFQKLINNTRLKELQTLRIVYYLKAFIGWLGAFTINIAFYILLISYIAQGHTVQAETVYFIQQCLFALRTATMVSIPMGICNTADLIAAFTRIQKFLDAEEVTSQIAQEPMPYAPKIYLNSVNVAIKRTNILKSVSIAHDKGLLVITGNVGSGKTVLLKTILGEYPVSSGQMEIRGSLSYAPEEPWLFPSTIKQNILFGQPYDEKRYQEVVNVCALTYDLNQFERSDQTNVGDKGINLSKGQQARITLARAIYRDSDIYLLDDCLSSLDNNVANYIFMNCIKVFLKNKITIFVTNNISILKQVSNSHMVFLENGVTLTLEQQNQSLDKRITYYIDEEDIASARRYRESIINKQEDTLTAQCNSNEDDELLGSKNETNLKENLYHEEKRDGGVLWTNYMTYYRYMGGFFVMVYLVVAFAAAQGALSYSEKLISLWVNLEPKITSLVNNKQRNITEYEESVNTRNQYLHLYTLFIITAMIISIIRSYSTFYVCINAAKSLHNAMVKAMLQASMYFYDSHYIGNIINRLSKDVYVIDENMPFLVFDFLRLIFSFIGVIVLVASVNLLFFIPAAILLIKLYFIQRIYIPTGRSLRRLEAATRSPVIGYLNSTLEGLSVARASQQENKLTSEFDSHQDLYTSAYYMNQTTMRFFAFLLDILGVFFVMGVLFKFLFFSEGVQAGDVGLAISQAMMLSGILQYATKQIAELENVMTSVERVLEYAEAIPEKESGKILSDWPYKGNIKFSSVSLTYKTDAHQVLNDISIEVEGGSKIGIIGRTGAGKTSIISALFRLYDFNGKIFIDNEDITDLSLDFLRANISIIPQDPVLFLGTIRTNIDPYDRFSDEDIWKTLEKVHLKYLISDLKHPVNNSGTAFSSGQKQLLCLARAIIQDTKIVVLDEATANLDPETDLQLQKTISSSFEKSTVIIIAHKLHSVMSCDKVLVLKDGKTVEYDEPNTLLKNKQGMLYKMISEENFETFVRLTHI